MATLIVIAGREPSEKEAAWLHEVRGPGKVVWLPLDGANDLGVPSLQRELDDAATVRVVFLGAEDERLPHAWLQAFAMQRVASIERLVGDDGDHLELVEHLPLGGKRPQVVVVLPGALFPVSMGSRQRIFQMLISLGDAGLAPVVVAPHVAAWPHEPLLKQLCVEVIWHHGSKALPVTLRRLRKTMKRVSSPLARGETFAAKQLKCPTREVAIALTTALVLFDIKSIIVNYAWMGGVMAELPLLITKRVKWICDTHDVNFVRDAREKGYTRWLTSSHLKQKRLELDALQKFDLVLAISKSDETHLVRELGRDKVRLVHSGFDYIRRKPERSNRSAPVFGFVGRNMRANTLALDIVLEQWWPALLRWRSDARLLIAGDICELRRLKGRASAVPGVTLCGVVSDLKQFYGDVDFCLNPVVVQGGLNFKSIEAVMAGRPLLTNDLGLKCLGDPEIGIACATPNDVVAAGERLWGERTTYLQHVASTQGRAEHLFSAEAAYSALFSELRSISSCPQAADTGQCTVLIQCGDHFENRQRILPLAQAIGRLGHHPVVLVYQPRYVNYFLTHGVDCVALVDFDESVVQRRERLAELRRADRHADDAFVFRGMALSEVLRVERLRDPKRYAVQRRAAYVSDTTRQIERLYRVLAHVDPDRVCIWNGYTGLVANVLRTYAQQRGLLTLFLERSIFPDGVFVDPSGVNAESELAGLDRAAIQRIAALLPPAARPVRSVFPSAAPWALAEVARMKGSQGRETILVPLQVQRDTNIVFSSEPVSAAELVRRVGRAFPGARLIVRPHPEEVDDLELPAGVQLQATGELAAWLEVCDRVATVNSTVGLEALLRGKPVASFGQSVYSKDGLTNTRGAPEATAVEAFYRVLVSRYTCLPESAPAVLEEYLGGVFAGAVCARACNADALSPCEVEKDWRLQRQQIRDAAIARGRLEVDVRLPPQARLQLTYRCLAEPVDDRWLEGMLRKELQLPEALQVVIRHRHRLSPFGRQALVSVRWSGRRGDAGAVDPYIVPLGRS